MRPEENKSYSTKQQRQSFQRRPFVANRSLCVATADAQENPSQFVQTGSVHNGNRVCCGGSCMATVGQLEHVSAPSAPSLDAEMRHSPVLAAAAAADVANGTG